MRIYNNTLVNPPFEAIRYFEGNEFATTNLYCNNAIVLEVPGSGVINSNADILTVATNNLSTNTISDFDFVDPVNGQYFLNNNSTLIDAGVNLDGTGIGSVVLNEDIIGQARPNNGLTDVGAFEHYACQTAPAVSGWSMISTYMDLSDPNVYSVLNPIIEEVTILKAGDGGVFWPQFNTNQIGSFTIGEGYKLNMNSEQTLLFIGTELVPETTVLNFLTGWNYIGYLRNSPGAVDVMLSSIIANIIIVKDGTGGVWWPQYGANTIGNMEPGQGYELNMTSGTTFSYPANSPSTKTGNTPVLYTPQHYICSLNTGENMSLMFPINCWKVTPSIGDEIGVFYDGMLVGSAIFTGGNMPLTIWGDDFLTQNQEGMTLGQLFDIKVWNSMNNTEYNLLIKELHKGNNFYENDGITVIKKVKTMSKNLASEDVFKRLVLYPNPANDYSILNIESNYSGTAEINVYNNTGQQVLFIPAKNIIVGNNVVMLNVHNLETGLYYVNVVTESDRFTRKLTIL